MSTTEMLSKHTENEKKLSHLKHQLAVSQAELVEIQAVIAEKDRQIAELRAQISRINDLQARYDTAQNILKGESVPEIVTALEASGSVSPRLAEALNKLKYSELMSILPALTE